MTAPNQNPFDIVPPRRPGTNDFNGVAKVDDAAFTPDPTTMPNAAEWNTIEFVLLALSRVMPVLVMSVTGGTTPAIASFSAAPSTLTIGTFTVVRNSAGDVSITWPAGTFPTALVAPLVTSNAGTQIDVDVVAITNGVRVRTWNGNTSTAADANFTLVQF